jgi:Putative Flp pilus-assembly TadE/G-like
MDRKIRIVMTMTAAAIRTNRRSQRERGQIMPMLALTIITMGVMGMLAITFGQAVVRRQQAQMVVDAAAFAGAAEQAKGLNTIARINEKEFNVTNAAIATQDLALAIGYHDSYTTTTDRLTCIFCTGPDWALDNWNSYRTDVFDTLNHAIDAINYAYGIFGKPYRAAKKVVDDNFGNSPEAVFQNEQPVEQGPVVWPLDVAYATTLVHLTPLQDYPVSGFRRYVPDSGALTAFCTEACAFIAEVPPAFAACEQSCENIQRAHYAAINTWFNGQTLIEQNQPRYPMGNFYANDEAHDVRFSYYLRVGGAQPLVGKGYFKIVPDLVVIATAKPYAGYLGAPYDEWYSVPYPFEAWNHAPYEQQDGKSIQYTYKAKLRPVTNTEKLSLAGMIEGTNAITDPAVLNRYIAVRH